MFTTLVESRARRERRGGGTVASIVVHTAVISLAVYATAKAGIRAAEKDQSQIIHFIQTPGPKPIETRPDAPRPPVFVPPRGGFDIRIDVPTSIPAVDLTKSIDTSFWTQRARGVVGSSNESAPSTASSEPYLVAQVEKPAAPAPGSAQPAYPPMLEQAGIAGRVATQFVVDTLGRVEPGSFRVLQSDNDLFDDAVKAALPRMRFYPAEVSGHRVRQLVEQEFTFQLR